MSAYVGPERRKGERRGTHPLDPFVVVKPDRRTAERRQEALAGVIVGLTAEEMEMLASFWHGYETALHEREATRS